MRAPFTGIVFALELTHDINVLLPLLVAAMLAHATTVLLLKRSILTEKVARRGLSSDARVCDRSARDSVCARGHADQYRGGSGRRDGSRNCASLALKAQPGRQYLFPVVDEERKLKGVLTRNELHEIRRQRLFAASRDDHA